MFEQTLFGDTKKYLALLADSKILPPATYLAGGTAMALHLGHRISYDLDFFTSEKFVTEKVLGSLQNLEEFKLSRTDWGTILGEFTKIKFSLFYYQYPLIEEATNYLGIDIAGLKDLAASKIGAISSRGTRRDFVDLYYLLQSKKIGVLQDFLPYYDQRFKNLATQKFHILKSLTYFEDADKEEDPKMLASDYSWEEVKRVLILETKKLI